MSTRATAAGSRADGDRCMRGGIGLLLGMPAAASESLPRARLDWKLLAAARLASPMGRLGDLPAGGLGVGGLPA